MGGRDPQEEHRASTPLELLFDLTFATSFSLAAAEVAHMVAQGHYGAASFGFGFASFAICWAWINFSWFASAYDTDDWIFRVATMVQMIGVLVLAIGLPRMFASIEHGAHVDNSVMVLGYVVMRVALVFQWLRAARQDPRRRRACVAYAIAVSTAQVGWIVQILGDFSLAATILMGFVLIIMELAGPVLAERMDGGTPWNAHHIVDRNAAFAIIALGEGVVGTVATLSAVVEEQGWSLDAALVSLAGVGLTFGIWWVYFMLPSARVLHVHRDRSFVWGYGQMLIVTAIVATGAGLHVAAYFIGHEAGIGSVATLLATAVPVAVFLGGMYALYAYLVQAFDPFHVALLLATAAVMALAIVLANFGVDMAVCLTVLSLAPAVTVVGYETRGHRHQAEALGLMEARDAHR
ncbi:MAG TPA: low temperature requirement protein A [Casimicrobiaceae bacterium]|jgi:low temperature requirement protein LtrA